MNKKQTLPKIRRCMRLFDETVPRWRQLIEIDNIDLGDEDNCPAGQIFGTYENGRDVLGLMNNNRASEYALWIEGLHPDDDTKGEYDKLSELWREVLRNE